MSVKFITRTLFLHLIILITSIHPQFSYGQDSLSLKIQELFKVSKSEKNYDLVLENLIENQKKESPFLGIDFWEKFETSFKDSIKQKLFNEVSKIYAKYFTEADIDNMINFYKTETGKKVISRLPLVMNESMEVGGKLGEDVGIYINRTIQLDRKIQMDSVYCGCDLVKEGEFYSEFKDKKFLYSRKGNKQVEKFNGFISEYEVQWLNDCKYVIKLTYTNNPNFSLDDNSMSIINITSVEKDGYHYVMKVEGDDFILSGKLYNLEK